VHSSERKERKQRRELLRAGSSRAGRQELPIPVNGAEVRADTRLTVSCVVAVASAYGLLTVSIALDSILLAFGNAVILLLILFVLFGWRELLEFNKKRSTAN
jgi:hypothetical protein